MKGELLVSDFDVMFEGEYRNHLCKAGSEVYTYGIGDNVKTNRNIGIGSKKSEVFEKYGESKLKMYDEDNDILVNIFNEAYAYSNLVDLKYLEDGDKYCDYRMENDVIENKEHVIRFYFGSDDKVKVIVFFSVYKNLDVYKNALGID